MDTHSLQLHPIPSPTQGCGEMPTRPPHPQPWSQGAAVPAEASEEKLVREIPHSWDWLWGPLPPREEQRRAPTSCGHMSPRGRDSRTDQGKLGLTRLRHVPCLQEGPLAPSPRMLPLILAPWSQRLPWYSAFSRCLLSTCCVLVLFSAPSLPLSWGDGVRQ